MGTVVAAEYLSVDGIMQDPGGTGELDVGGWSNKYWNDELAAIQSDLLFASDALLLGRVTYEGFAAAWPDMEHEEGPFAEKMNSMPKYVASRTLKTLEWNASLIEGDVAEAIHGLKRKSDRTYLIYGSASLVRLLTQRNLIDRYRLMIHPVLLGQGKPLFAADTKKNGLRLVDSKTTLTGVAVLDYTPAVKADR
jgi:dihydrofolate reductase